MAPRRTQAEQPMNDWEEFRRTIMMMHENLLDTIQTSFRELTETIHDRDRDRNRERQQSDDGLSDEEDNPFAGEDHRRNRARPRIRDRDDRSWELGFKVELPEFHGGVRGEEL
ncbi:hypothetical protein Bca4012_093558 [Brassica carinata]